jgi:LDH2 family malate/lactate/ureidoglycolate dehydrogenase
MYAQLRGNNQGVIKITSGGVDKLPNEGAIFVEHETGLSAVLNGNNSSGMVALYKATQMAVDKCKAGGFGIVGTNHTSTSTGALG